MRVENASAVNNEKITGVQIFLASRCNLSCRYCYISKEASLIEFDTQIREMLENGTYAQAIVDLNAKVGGDISTIELWGGEPTLNLDSFRINLPVLFAELPKLNRIVMSSNMVGNPDKITDILLSLDSRNSGTPFTFNLQVSLDGPSWVNDENRGGKNSSERIIANLERLISAASLYKTKFEIMFKATLPIDIMRRLSSFEKILEYFKFWDDLILRMRKAAGGKVAIEIHENVMPTVVYPGTYSREDGVAAAQFLRNLGRLAKWTNRTGELKTYRQMDMFNIRWNRTGIDLPDELPFCGVYKNHVALLYTGDIVACHRAFLDLIDGYVYSGREEMNKRNVMAESKENRLSIRSRVLNIYDKEFLSKLEKTKSQYVTSESRVAAIGFLIRAMANIGQVSSIYKDEAKALEAALIVRNQNDCTYDNQITTGTVSLTEVGMIRLMCNGVIEYILDKEIGGMNIARRV